MSAAALVLAWLTLPVAAQAYPDTLASLAESSVCTASVTIQLASPAIAVPSSPLAPVSYIVNASMTCTGVGTTQVSITASGWTAVAPTCAQIVSANGSGSAFVGSSTYPVNLGFAGPTAAPQFVAYTPAPLVGPTALALTGPLMLSAASLQACLQPSGTTSLQYTGVLALTS